MVVVVVVRRAGEGRGVDACLGTLLHTSSCALGQARDMLPGGVLQARDMAACTRPGGMMTCRCGGSQGRAAGTQQQALCQGQCTPQRGAAGPPTSMSVLRFMCASFRWLVIQLGSLSRLSCRW